MVADDGYSTHSLAFERLAETLVPPTTCSYGMQTVAAVGIYTLLIKRVVYFMKHSVKHHAGKESSKKEKKRAALSRRAQPWRSSSAKVPPMTGRATKVMPLG